MVLKEEDLVLCTVKKMEGTTIFVDIEGEGQGSLTFSEIAAGRIRNIRDYVVPNKRIVCKVMKIMDGHPQLSLRRVTGKERDEVVEKYEKAKTFTSLLKTITKDPQILIDKIKVKYDLAEFIDKIKENPSLASEFLAKDELEKLVKILSEKKDKEKIVKKIIKINSDSESGIEDIKYILASKTLEIHYLGSSQYSVQTKGTDFKIAQQVLDSAIQEMCKKAKEKKAFLEIKEK